ncbi:MAG: hypothetical protein MJE66_12515 [Proteobacteria bacterium]|nr:hypothetical protein [Pseudomonadota bacterium]
MRSSFVRGGVFGGALAAFVLAVGSAQAAPEEPRTSMRQVFLSLVQLLPPALEGDRFVDPARRASIAAALDDLAAAGERVRRHGRGADTATRLLTRDLADEAQEMSALFSRGRAAEARYRLLDLTETCVACHTRGVAAGSFPLGARLVERLDAGELSPRGQARLRVALRDFEGSARYWETVFRDPTADPAELDASEALLDYMTLVVRTRPDFARARTQLRALAARDDCPRYLRRRIRVWDQHLDRAEPKPDANPSLKTAREHLERATDVSDFPGDRDGMVHTLLAAAELSRLVEHLGAADTKAEAALLAESFYWLGVAELRLGPASWVPKAEIYLESAIRTAPSHPYAERAYALLEEVDVLTFGGVGPEYLPPRVRATLAELRRLIESQQTTRAEPARRLGSAR